MLSIEVLIGATLAVALFLVILKKYILKKKAPAYIKELSTDYEVGISEFDAFHGRVLVLDKNQKKLLFTWYGHTKVPVIIDLSKILSCKIHKHTAMVEGQPHMNRIELILKPKFHKGDEDIHLNMYVRHGEGLLEESFYYQMAKKWVSKIETVLERSLEAAA